MISWLYIAFPCLLINYLGQSALLLKHPAAVENPFFFLAPEWARLLDEIGFTVGERVEVMVRGVPGGDPLAVRIGDSTFALRRAEAACIEVCREMSSEGGAQ